VRDINLKGLVTPLNPNYILDMETSKTTLIEAPASLVFKILFDVDLATTWVPNLTYYEVISKTEHVVGSTYRSRFDFTGLKYEQVSEIKEYVENQRVEWLATSKFCDGKVDYFLTEISDSRTEFKQISQCQYKGLTKFWIWLAKSKTKKASEDYMREAHENLKTLVEVEYTSGIA